MGRLEHYRHNIQVLHPRHKGADVQYMKIRKTYSFVIILTLFLIISVGFEVRAASNGFVLTDKPSNQETVILPHADPFDIYIYMEKREDKPDYAHNVTLTLISGTGTSLRSWTGLSIPAGEDVAIVNDIFWSTKVEVYLKVTGYIHKNKKDDYFEATSNLFWIEPSSPPPAQPGLGQILWEKEVL